EKIGNALHGGLSATELIGDRRPVDILIRMYTRSDRLGACLKVMVDAGAVIDAPLYAVLADDEAALAQLLVEQPEMMNLRYTIPCAFTPLDDASLLHLCAEYGSIRCAQLLLDRGMDPDIRAGVDEQGLGGQTPIFHTVNANANRSRPVMECLLQAGASPDLHVRGFVWGRGNEWETFIPEVNPVNYAMMGNLPQFHRSEEDIANNVRLLLRYLHGKEYEIRNVPNAYVARSRKISS
ncbi:MAG: ankyrin repeat domain-containing protein, partial [Saprospiraceae bacterium]|nr:ankyrin repeat domain-containing protein [Saprospiraceae bacterium]